MEALEDAFEPIPLQINKDEDDGKRKTRIISTSKDENRSIATRSQPFTDGTFLSNSDYDCSCHAHHST